MVYGRVVAWNKLIKRSIIKENFPVGLLYEDIEFFYKLIPQIKLLRLWKNHYIFMFKEITHW